MVRPRLCSNFSYPCRDQQSLQKSVNDAGDYSSSLSSLGFLRFFTTSTCAEVNSGRGIIAALLLAFFFGFLASRLGTLPLGTAHLPKLVHGVTTLCSEFRTYARACKGDFREVLPLRGSANQAVRRPLPKMAESMVDTAAER